MNGHRTTARGDLTHQMFREITSNAAHCSNTSLAQCSGQLDAVSFLADYRFASRFDAYAGIMWSQVSNGLANGFLQRSNIDPTIGLRFQF
jgi:hypothetical protein